MKNCARLVAFYLPQYHPIPENNRWWGPGFTEWTNVAKAKPLFRDHYQPRLPADLGFYDLRNPEAREAQAALARSYGIEGFCYWHYYFAGKRLLERPFEEVLRSGKPDYPFCLGWANESWSGLWAGGDEKRIIQEQTYPGLDDYKRHFEELRPAFADPRYITVEGKPLFLIYRPLKIPNPRRALDYWRTLAINAGLPGLHLVAHLEYGERDWDFAGNGYDGVTVWTLGRVFREARARGLPARLKLFLKRNRRTSLMHAFERVCPGPHLAYDYSTIRSQLVCPTMNPSYYPMLVPNWDTTARYSARASIFHNSTPEAFRSHFGDVLEQVKGRSSERRIVFVKSWNEWAEGNYLEPDERFGHQYLEVIREELERFCDVG